MTKRFNITIINGKPTCAELAGYELPEFESDPIGQPLTDYVNQRHNQDECSGFIDGYHKARERFEFSESDLRQAMLFGSMRSRLSPNELELSFNQLLQSIRNRTPIAIEVEMVEVFYHANMPKEGEERPPYKPDLNPDGTVKGTYIFNE